MKQQQSIGSANKGQSTNRQQQKTPLENRLVTKPDSQKPAVTDDSGNIIDKDQQDAGNGYAEKKPTESYRNAMPADEKPANVAPNQQHPDTEKVYGPKTHDNVNIHHNEGFPEQNKNEENDQSEERMRQAGNVPG